MLMFKNDENDIDMYDNILKIEKKSLFFLILKK
jgi:hypothetical protein